MSFNPLNYPLCFEKPQRLTDVTSWHEHIPFAFTIVQMLKPKIFVELGTHKGDSYCAFCQAVNVLGLDTACYAVDTWEGDEHSGLYGSEILEELRTYHDSRYKGFSQLIQSRFEEALDYFSDGSIDLIHIDGCHTYDAIKHDFEAWLPKMSQRGVILFHDINVHERDFGVWKFWEEVAEHHPSFEFKHGYGLGVLAVGAEVPEELLAFLNMGEQEVVATTKLYSYLGDKIALGHQLQSRDEQVTELNSTLQARDTQIAELNGALQARDTQITELNGALQSRDTQITELNSALQSRDTQITELNGALQSRDEQVTELTSALQSRDEEVTELNGALQASDDQVTELTSALQSRDTQITELNGTLQSKDAHIQNLENVITENNIKLNDIYRSTTWQVLTKYQHLVDSLLPHTTKRRHVYDLGIISMRIIVNDGFSAFLYKLKERVRGSAIDASKIALIQTNVNPPHVPLSLARGLCGNFTFPTNNLNEIRVLTATYQRRNSDLELHIINSEGQIIRKLSIKGHRIQDNEYTSFKFKPIKDSKEQTFIFKLISKGGPSAAVWHNESVTVPELALIYDDAPINGSIGFQAFADIGIKSRYGLWMLKNEPTQAELEQYKEEIQNFEYQPKISIVTPVYNPDVAWIKAAIESVINQIYGNWELCLADASTKDDVKKCLEAYAKKDSRIKVKFVSENKGISGNSNEALSLATGDYIGLLDHDDELSPDALYEVVKHLQTNRDADMIYSDEDKIDLDGNRSDPFFKPDWSPDMFLSHNYLCHFSVIRKSLIDKLGGFRKECDGSQDYDLFLRTSELSRNIEHIPKILYHWRVVPGSAADNVSEKPYALIASKRALKDTIVRRKIDAEILDGLFPNSYRTKYNINGNPKVSIIIPTKDKVDILKTCINSILIKTDYSNYEILIIDNQSKEEVTFDYYNEIRSHPTIKIVEYKLSFNFSAINNFAVSLVDSDYITLLNNDTEIISAEWLAAMLEHAQRKEVGAVGAKLLYTHNTVQHAGVIVGIIGNPPIGGHAFRHLPASDIGYFGRVQHVHNLSAVTAACMMMRKDVFEEVGGFDENLAVAFNDVDLCLKIREKGYLIVYTPYAELYHHESLSRGYEDTPEKQERFLGEVRYMREKWGEVIDEGDPYYNPNLTLERDDFTIRI